tara:strand:- start:69031 stop:69543 length:513 start_codon:yes stop_codon:yes gene_type:complete
MKKLQSILFQPDTNIFQGVMTIDTFGLAQLASIFARAYIETVEEEAELVDLEESWVQELAAATTFEYRDLINFYNLGENTVKMQFEHEGHVLEVEEDVPEHMIEEFGKIAQQRPEAFPLKHLIRFLTVFNFTHFIDQKSDDVEIDFDTITEFHIRDYVKQEEIVIATAEL